MALDPIADLTGAGISEAQGKTWFTNMRAYLAGLLGTDGVPATSRTALGLGTIATQAASAVAITGGTISGVPITQNSQSANYTTVASDSNKHIFHPLADNNPRTFTIDSNANVPYALGTTITFVNFTNVLTIAITSDTMFLAGVGTTGSRSLSSPGIATALKVTTTQWIISGIGLT